jgi:hypothetical protein
MSRSKADCVGITNTGNPWFYFLVTESEGAPFLQGCNLNLRPRSGRSVRPSR